MADIIAILEDIHLDYLTKYILLYDQLELLDADPDHCCPHPDLVSYDDRGFFPLLVAVCLGSADICELFLERGCPVEQAVPQRHYAEHYVATALHEVCLEGRLDLAKLLLRDQSSDFRFALHQENHLGMSSGHMAVKSGRLDLLRWLCGMGYNLSSKDHHGNNLLHYACSDDDSFQEMALMGSSDFSLLWYLLSLNILSPLEPNNAGYGALQLAAREPSPGEPMRHFLRHLSGKLTQFEKGLLGSFLDAEDAGYDQCRVSDERPDVFRYIPGVLHRDVLSLAVLSPVSRYLTSLISYMEQRGDATDSTGSVCKEETPLSLLSDHIRRIRRRDPHRLMAAVENAQVLMESGAAFCVMSQCTATSLLELGVVCHSPRLVKLVLLYGVSASLERLSSIAVTPLICPLISLLVAGGMSVEHLTNKPGRGSVRIVDVPDSRTLYVLYAAGQNCFLKRLLDASTGNKWSVCLKLIEQFSSPATLEVLCARMIRRQYGNKVFWNIKNMPICDMLKRTLLFGYDVHANSEPLVYS
ncbi:hypothetical protein LSH36_165g05036 [Paralvinella palmiformis]|uniref:Ankyrin repeat protein n=1 Tax=Paralvinella palmiformis TaxID=53620 RepID=A0AAD9JUL1_9ANNE|nr:hypothetical protein LSH36_165g05036 [Paralvinella palmiformis]